MQLRWELPDPPLPPFLPGEDTKLSETVSTNPTCSQTVGSASIPFSEPRVALAYKNIINITHYESRARKPVELQHFASASDDPPLPPFPPGEEQQCLQSVTNSKCHLLPKSRLNLDPPLGALQLSPAVSLPLLAKLPPRVNCFLEEKQQAAADKLK